jgi:hypothetical protein
MSIRAGSVSGAAEPVSLQSNRETSLFSFSLFVYNAFATSF